MKTASKAGRKPKYFRDSDGKEVHGLTRNPDGRWRIVGTQIRFTETDEKKAIERFHRLRGTRPSEDEIVEMGWSYDATDDDQRAIYGPSGILSRGAWQATERMWKYVAEQIIRYPQRAAQLTGIEWLAYGPTLRPPKPLPSFQELEETFEKHFHKSDKQRVLGAWEHFKTTTGAKVLRDITPELVIGYRDNVHETRGTGKSQSNIFNRVRRLLSFAKSRAIAIKEIADVLEIMSLLVPSETQVSLDPKPIEKADWSKLYAASEGANQAMILLMLNGGFYLTEVIRLKWSDIRVDGTIITHREKEGRCVRVCVLWKETLDALKKLPRKGEHLFYSWQGLPLGIKGANRRFGKIRDKARLPHVTSSMLRDGAATAAAEGNVNQQLISLLLGHRVGISDHYVKRRPKMVAPACEAIYQYYLGMPLKIASNEAA